MAFLSTAENQEIVSQIRVLNANFNVPDLLALSQRIHAFEAKYSWQELIEWLTELAGQYPIVHGLLAQLYYDAKAYDWAKEQALEANRYFPCDYWRELIRSSIMNNVLQRMKSVCNNHMCC